MADDVRTFETGFERQEGQRPSRMDIIPAGPMRRRWSAEVKARIIASSLSPAPTSRKSRGRDELNEGELAGTIDRDIQIKFAFGGPDLGDIDVEIADWIGPELALGFLVAGDLGQPADAVALQASVQRGSRQVRDRGLQRVKAIVERQQRVPSEGDDDRFLFDGQDGRLDAFGPAGRSPTAVRFLHLATVLGLMPWRLANTLRLS